MKKYILFSLPIILFSLILAGCGGGNNQVAKDGDIVSVHYTGTLGNGSQFDSSYDRGQPLTFTVGAGQMIAGFDNAVRGMKVGETKTVNIPPEEAYGPHYDELVAVIPWDNIPDDLDIYVGARLQMTTYDGQVFDFIVSAIDDAGVTVDANHELAGETLIFEIELVSITTP